MFLRGTATQITALNFYKLIRFIHTSKFACIKIFKSYSTMFSSEIVREAKYIFHHSVKAVQPGELVRKSVRVLPNQVEIQGKFFPVNRNVYIVGFGKAVLGMALELENLLYDHVISGVLSVPTGMQMCGLSEYVSLVNSYRIF